MDAKARALLAQHRRAGTNAPEWKLVLLDNFNRLIFGPPLYDKKRFKSVKLRPETVEMQKGGPQGADVARLNRLLLEDAYPMALARNHYPAPYTFSTLAVLPKSAGFFSMENYIPYQPAMDSSGNLYFARNQTIQKLTPTGVLTNLAGAPGKKGSKDGTGSAVRFNDPTSVAVDAKGNVYVADTFNETIRKVTPKGVVTTLAGVAGKGGTADGTGKVARFALTFGIAVDATGNVYVADSGASTIRKIVPGREVVAQVFVDAAGGETTTGTTPATVTTLAGLAGKRGSTDGTGSEARFNFPVGMAFDLAGNLYVADASNDTIRRVTPAGVVTTLAGAAGKEGSTDGTGSQARFSRPEGIAVDPAGNVFVADSANQLIRKITPAGEVTTLAGAAGNTSLGVGGKDETGGETDITYHVFFMKINFGKWDGTGSAARFLFPTGVVVDNAGNLYVTDAANRKIRKGTPPEQKPLP